MPITRSLTDVLEELGADSHFPPNTTFAGYVIRIPDNDEFLANYHIDLDAVSMRWVKIPDLAMIFETAQDASQVIIQLDKPGVMLGWLFDLGKQFYAVSMEPDSEGD